MQRVTVKMATWAGVKQLAALRQSTTFATSVRNAGYNVADQLAQPVLLLAAAPFLTSHLGLDQFGVWMLVLALAGSMPVFNLGLGDATIKYVSKYRGSGDPAGVVRIFRANLAMGALLGALAGSAVFLMAPLLARWIFHTQPQKHALAAWAVELGGLILALRSIESILAGSLRAFEDYAGAAKVSVSVKCGIVGTAVFLVALGRGVLAILLATAIWVALGLVAYGAFVRQVVPGVNFWPAPDQTAWREISTFGFYSWLQSVAAALFSNADRLLVGALLGTTELAYYAICLQLAAMVQALPAAAFNFIFPHMSSRSEAGERETLRRVFRLAAAANLVGVMLLALPLLGGGKRVLAVWMGAGFAEHSYSLLAALIVGYALLAVNVVPHFALLGLGQARPVCMANLVAGTLATAGMALLIPVAGLVGAGLGRLLYGVVLTLCYIQATRGLRVSGRLVVPAATHE